MKNLVKVIFVELLVIGCFAFMFFNDKQKTEENIPTRNTYSEIRPLYNIYTASLTTYRPPAPPEPEVFEGTYSLYAVDSGMLMYSPGRWCGYRYGPSIMKYNDGSVDVWFSSPGNNSTEWDYARYQHSDDGIEYTEEEIVLRPTPGSRDHFSVCDPGVVYFNEYYYIGYTSTVNPSDKGIYNHLFVARSKSPTGPFEKWSGDGWGDNPQPIITFTGGSESWGCGEPSFVVYGEELYIYYTWSDGYTSTKLAIADLSQDWPSTIRQMGTVITRDGGQDSYDVIYVDELEMFYAFTVENRFLANSGIRIYTSYDGFNFRKLDLLRANIHPYAHNLGVSRGKEGHVSVKDDLILGYAYAEGEGEYYWGRWSTNFHTLRFYRIY